LALASSDPEPVPQSIFGDSLPASHQLPEASRSNISFDEAVVGRSVQSLNAERHSVVNFPPAEAAASSVQPEVSFQSFSGFSIRSTTPPRLLNFKIEYRDRTIELSVFDNERVGKAKFEIRTSYFLDVI